MNAKQLNAFQSAWVVDDIEVAALHWAEHAGVGPFFVADYHEGVLEESTYRGAPAPITMKTALAQAGDMQIELIQPTGIHRNIYRDTVPVGKPAFHHIAVWTDNFEVDLAKYVDKGFEIAASGRAGGAVRFAYIDTCASLGHMVELVEDTQDVRSVFQMITDASLNWDGSNPVRDYG
ncbi:MAG: VOC family protein [Pseudomonadales bacterium]